MAPVQFGKDAQAQELEAARARLSAHRARVEAATAPVKLTERATSGGGGNDGGGDGSSGGAGGGGGGRRGPPIHYGDVLLVARGGGGKDDDPLLLLSADPFGGAAGVWSWGHGDEAPPALPASALPPSSSSLLLPPLAGTASTALRVLPAAAKSSPHRSPALGDPLRYGDRFALAVEDPRNVWRARGGGGGGGHGGGGGRAADGAPLLLLVSRAPGVAHSLSSRVPGSSSDAQAVAFVRWTPAAADCGPPSDATWVALPADREQRLLLAGEAGGGKGPGGDGGAAAVRAGAALLLAHAPTRRPLWWGGQLAARWDKAPARLLLQQGLPMKGRSGAAAEATATATTATATAAAAPPGGERVLAELGPPAAPPNVWRMLLGGGASS